MVAPGSAHWDGTASLRVASWEKDGILASPARPLESLGGVETMAASRASAQKGTRGKGHVDSVNFVIQAPVTAVCLIILTR